MSDAKLLRARARIQAVLNDLDIAGHVVLHNKPGSIEVFSKLDPTYSKLIGLPPLVRIRSKLADYQGDAEAQRRDLEATTNMVSSMAQVLGQNALMLLELASLFDAKTGAEHTALRRDDDPPVEPER